VGVLYFYFKQKQLKKGFPYIFAFSAGSLLGGALLHMMPQSIAQSRKVNLSFTWFIIGFSIFFLLEQVLNWHRARHHPKHFKHHTRPKINNQPDQDLSNIKHTHNNRENKSTSSYLILFADGLHNFIGGIAIASSFLINPNIGIITVFSAAAHEIPQEFGDFAILVHG
jgi:zinc and cadmium transporter